MSKSGRDLKPRQQLAELNQSQQLSAQAPSKPAISQASSTRAPSAARANRTQLSAAQAPSKQAAKGVSSIGASDELRQPSSSQRLDTQDSSSWLKAARAPFKPTIGCPSLFGRSGLLRSPFEVSCQLPQLCPSASRASSQLPERNPSKPSAARVQSGPSTSCPSQPSAARAQSEPAISCPISV